MHQPSFSGALFSLLDSSYHYLIQYVPLKITLKNEWDVTLLKTTTFLLNHNAQHRATTLINMWFIHLKEKLTSQELNNWATLLGGWMLNAIKIVFQNPCYMTIKKEMLNIFLWATKATFCTSLPTLFNQILLNYNHSFH